MPESMRSVFLLEGIKDVNFVGVHPIETMIVLIVRCVYYAVMSPWSKSGKIVILLLNALIVE